jgi:hypothetical protein
MERPITTSQELAQIARLRNVFMHTPPLRLQVAGLRHDELIFWQNRINKRLSACGCAEGAAFFLVSVGLYVVWLRAFGQPAGWLMWSTAGLGVLIAGTTALMGKLIGIVGARLLLKRDVRNLAARAALAVIPLRDE